MPSICRLWKFSPVSRPHKKLNLGFTFCGGNRCKAVVALVFPQTLIPIDEPYNNHLNNRYAVNEGEQNLKLVKGKMKIC